MSSFQESKGEAPATNVWFSMKADQETAWPLFAFAALWRHHQVEMQDPDTDRDTYTVITKMANTLIELTHPTRMPIIFSPQ